MKTIADVARDLRNALDHRFGDPNASGANLWRVPLSDCVVLIRAQRTLHRWAELECGDGDDRASWGIQRNDETGKPYLVTWVRQQWNVDVPPIRRSIPDRETAALKRVAKLCQSLGLHYYHQTDPRGCALYVSTEPLTGQNYTNGVACC